MDLRHLTAMMIVLSGPVLAQAQEPVVLEAEVSEPAAADQTEAPEVGVQEQETSAADLSAAGQVADLEAQLEVQLKEVESLTKIVVNLLAGQRGAEGKADDRLTRLERVEALLAQLCPETGACAPQGASEEMEAQLGKVLARLDALETQQAAIWERLNSVGTISQRPAAPGDGATDPGAGGQTRGAFGLATNQAGPLRVTTREVGGLNVSMPTRDACAEAGAWFLSAVEAPVRNEFFVRDGNRVRLCTYNGLVWSVVTARAFAKAYVVETR